MTHIVFKCYIWGRTGARVAVNGVMQIWTEAKTRKGKRQKICFCCKEPITSGSLSWRELAGNSLTRALRICQGCFPEKMERGEE